MSGSSEKSEITKESRKKSRKRFKRKPVKYSRGSKVYTLRNFSFLLALITAGFIVFLAFGRNKDEGHKNAVAKAADPEQIVAGKESAAEQMLQKYTPETILEMTRIMPKRYSGLELPLKVREMETRIETLEKLRNKDLSDALYNDATQMLLRYYSLADDFNMENSLDRITSRSRLFEFIDKIADSPDNETVAASKYITLAVSINEMRSEPSQETYDFVVNTLQLHGDEVALNPKDAKGIANVLLQMVRENRENPLVEKVQKQICDSFLASPDLKIQNLGQLIFEDAIFKGADTYRLREQIALKIPGSQDKFASALEVLETNPDLSVSRYVDLIAANESLASIERYDDAKNVASYLLQIREKIASNETKQFLENVVKRQLVRFSLVDQPFDLMGTTFDGQPIEKLNGFTVIAFWSVTDKASSSSMENLIKSVPQGSHKKYRIISVCTDQITPKLRSFISTTKTDVVFASDDTSVKLLKQCPVDILPYVIIVKPDQTVAAINLPLSLFEERIKQIMIQGG